MSKQSSLREELRQQLSQIYRYGQDSTLVSQTVLLNDLIDTLLAALPDALSFPDIDTKENSPAFVNGSEYGWFHAVKQMKHKLTEARKENK